jgi:hypothetical protein
MIYFGSMAALEIELSFYIASLRVRVALSSLWSCGFGCLLSKKYLSL